ncbi:50S ribosomal protein L19 [Candidatus Gottesmanbacteria bacterium RBG_13_37_7]|uniref:50S ribosomal protein L19 n=1 Tax=Candidatus Gottesmanbacteria bacterium RBG_13_37_7 TaxID=1798369 RepID=A0A1F5YI44_9BACT|nr:MAG: 50S ribosomal protein L19 [Candidatus Gottesmanbacteria bacterium RBG_13_37_7]
MALRAKHQNTSFSIGDTIKVHYKLIEKEKVSGKAKREVKEVIRERIQVFEGIIIAIRGSQKNKSITVRRIGADKVGIERIFPLISPWIKKITIAKKGKVRRAKLYYLRDKLGKEAEKIKEKVDKKPAIKETKEKKLSKKKTEKKLPHEKK